MQLNPTERFVIAAKSEMMKQRSAAYLNPRSRGDVVKTKGGPRFAGASPRPFAR